MNHVAGSRSYTRALTARANRNRHRWIHKFGVRPKRHRLNFTIKTSRLVIADDADDFTRLDLVFHINLDSLADCVLTRKDVARESLVNHDDVAHLDNFLRRIQTPALQRYVHRLKVIRVRHTDAG